MLIVPVLGRAEGLGAYLKATRLRFDEEPVCTDKSVIHLSVVLGVHAQSPGRAVTVTSPSSLRQGSRQKQSEQRCKRTAPPLESRNSPFPQSLSFPSFEKRRDWGHI